MNAVPITPVTPIRQKVGCCRQTSLCCCRCIFLFSLLIAVAAFGAGGYLLYTKDDSSFTEKISDISNGVYPGSTRETIWGGLSVVFFIAGGVMAVVAIISGSCMCCLKPQKCAVPPSSYVIVASPPQQPSSVVLPAQPSGAAPPARPTKPPAAMPPIPAPSAPPHGFEIPSDYAPPPYESLEKGNAF